MTNLRLVGATVTGELVNKDDWNPFAGLLVIELNVVVGR
jgi:hypothetical protein